MIREDITSFPLPDGFEYRLELKHHVTPRLLKDQPVHRWFWFPHSFSPQLIDKILKEYPIPEDGWVLDPFVGAGTTVLRASELGYPAVGTDLSPLSLFVSRVKLSLPDLDKGQLQEGLRFILDYSPLDARPPLPLRLQKAFTRDELAHIFGLRRRIEALPQPMADFFLLALLRVQQRLSRAVPDGGWFRWVEKEDQSKEVCEWFRRQAECQIGDIRPTKRRRARVFQDDARELRTLDGAFDLVITSPPYPNRHDYSRIFHIELLMLGVGEEGIKAFRRSSIRSHVEARSPYREIKGYRMPSRLGRVLEQFPEGSDTRIPSMLRGYFEDMYLVLKALRAHLRLGALCAFVVGNVRHAGVMVPVDEILVDIGIQLGYSPEGVWVARLRGNSAQQMGRFGREPARESVVFLRNG